MANSHSSDSIIPSSIIQSDFGIQCDGEVVLQAGQTLFNIRLSHNPPDTFDKTNTFEEIFLHELEDAALSDDLDKFDKILERLGNTLAVHCQTYFRKYARFSGSSRNSLQFYTDLPIIYLQLVTEHNSPKVILRDDDRPLSDFRSPSLGEIDDLPNFKLSDVEVTEIFIHRRVFKVVAAGREYCCKLDSKCGSVSILREIQILQKLSSLEGSENTLRVPRLEGMVGLRESVPGILLTFITHKCRLSEMDIETVPEDLRRKSADQIRTTVKILHSNDIIWGDVKAENVLIDPQDNAWLVDFGGGWTQLWVEPKLEDTVEGDLQGLSRMDEFLSLKAEIGNI